MHRKLLNILIVIFFQKLLEKIDQISKEKEDSERNLQEQLVSLEDEYEVCNIYISILRIRKLL